ncbi:MAG: GNAT family N-acetyltransferase [Oligoflexia bacterium]|nr:GNAT family N-acetyltransferase [Oligoflexia bacterium]
MNIQKIKLIKPTVELKDTFLKGLKEFQQEKLPWVMDFKIDELEKNFDDFVKSQLNKKTLWTKDTPVDETELWAVIDKTYVGRISIRHKLNADLLVMGGHIGYDTCPSYRRKGVASAMLKKSLPIAKQLGIFEAMLTCNDDNIASIKIIEKNGGVLKERKVQYKGGPIKRYYWINL